MTGAAATRAGPARPGVYLTLLTWAFTLFSTARIAAYLPTLWAIHASGDASQHSLWTWGTWLGANTTMALWLLEHEQRRLGRAVVVNGCNALLCAAIVVMILLHR
jgi:hypothetical protein